MKPPGSQGARSTCRRSLTQADPERSCHCCPREEEVAAEPPTQLSVATVPPSLPSFPPEAELLGVGMGPHTAPCPGDPWGGGLGPPLWAPPGGSAAPPWELARPVLTPSLVSEPWT